MRDVYKRQGIQKSLTDTERLRCNLKEFIPVSYTHLDVYKRQVNRLTCGKGAKELSEQILGKDVQVLLLQNHGIFVAANTVEEIGALFDGVISKLEKQVKRTADVSDAVTCLLYTSP